MLSEILGFLSALDAKSGSGSKFRVNLNKNRIRSISAYSSNSIFYFPMILSDQATPEEAAMIARTTEKMNASFVVACIGLMPFHRIKADDKASIEEYLRQFHQNLGFNGDLSGAAAQKFLGFVDSLQENYNPDDLKQVQDFLYECWEKSKKENTDYVKLVSESISILDMYNEDPIDPKTRVMQEAYHASMEEMKEWGFLGEASDDMFDDFSEDDLDLDDEDLDDEDWDEDDELDPDDYPEDAYADIESLLGEAAMKAAKRNSLPDDAFGLPSQRKFPLNDKKHVRLAIQMFKHCPEKDRKELAGNIKKAAAKFGMKIETEGTAAKYLSESSVGEAISNIKFSLEAVSENKILSCKNLTKLKTLENKLLKLKNRYIKYLNRYKKKWKENKKSGSKSKLVIRFNNMSISDPKAFMKEFGEYIKIINKRLKLVEKRRAQLHSEKGDVVMAKDWKEDKKVNEATELGELGKMEFDAVDYCITAIDQQITAPDNQVFELVDDDDDEAALEEAAIPRHGKEYSYGFKDAQNRYIGKARDASRKAEKMADRLTAAEQRTRRQEQLTQQARQQAADARKQAADAERQGAQMQKENERLQKQLDDQKKTRAQLRNERESEKPDGVFFRRGRAQSDINPYLAADAQHTSFQTFERQVFTDMDMKKANDAVPTFAKASIGFVIDETEEVVTRDVLVGIKSYIHRAPSKELIDDVYNCIINKRKFLKFVKFVTGEERSLSDLLFGIRELRSDALDGKRGAGQWRSAFKRRRRWAKMSIPYLMKEYTPNGTLVMTMNEVEFIKSEYGIDVMDPGHVKMIMDADFLLSFVILDQANEMVYIVYDGQGYTFQQYTYAMLERSDSSGMSDRAMRELYRSFSR